MRLHIGNLPSTVTETELKELMVPFAAPASLEIIKDHGGVSKGFGFADFAEAEGARAVISGLDGKEIDGKTLKVAEARPRKADRV